MAKQMRTEQERFREKIAIDPSGCHLWVGSLDGYGYGMFRVRTTGGRKGWKTVRAHIVAARLAGLTAEPNQIVRHTCDVPGCVNPQHLLLGSYQDNMGDRNDRNRTAVGIKVGTAVLTEDEVMEIQISRDSAKDLAQKFGVVRSTIYAIRTRRTWKHL